MIKVFSDEPLIRLAKLGYSASEIVEELSLPITVRQVQRIVAPHRAGERCVHCGSWLRKRAAPA